MQVLHPQILRYVFRHWSWSSVLTKRHCCQLLFSRQARIGNWHCSVWQWSWLFYLCAAWRIPASDVRLEKRNVDSCWNHVAGMLVFFAAEATRTESQTTAKTSCQKLVRQVLWENRPAEKDDEWTEQRTRRNCSSMSSNWNCSISLLL